MTGKNILVYDFGIGLEHARALGRAGNTVKYYTPWGAGFPSFKSFAVGLGYKNDNVEKVLYFFEWIDWADLIFFPDVGAGDIAEYLSKTTKKPIFGAGKAEAIEQNRVMMRKKQKELGLPTQNTTIVKGLPELRKYLEKNPKKVVKIDIFREDVESFASDSYDKIKLSLNEIEVGLGPFNETFQFIAEDMIDGIEPGFDLFFNGKEFLKPYLWGVEYKKKGYIGKFVDKLPSPLQDVADRLTPFLQKTGYRGALSTEFRMKGGKPYLIDTCARFAYPLSTAYGEVIKNYSDVIWAVANGQDIKIEPISQYFAIAPLYDLHARDKYVRLDFPKELSNHIKPRGSAVVGNVTYSVPPGDIVFVIVSWANSYDQCLKDIEKLSKDVESPELNTDSIDTLKKAIEVIDKFPENGLGKF